MYPSGGDGILAAAEVSAELPPLAWAKDDAASIERIDALQMLFVVLRFDRIVFLCVFKYIVLMVHHLVPICMTIYTTAWYPG